MLKPSGLMTVYASEELLWVIRRLPKRTFSCVQDFTSSGRCITVCLSESWQAERGIQFFVSRFTIFYTAALYSRILVLNFQLN